MSLTPSVSVVVPVFNADAYVSDAVRSVFRQGDCVLEVIVVDDGSTDRSVGAVRRIGDARCRVLSQQNRGAAAARNAGVRTARGALLAFIDADDVWPEGRLAAQVGALDGEPGLDLVFGHYLPIDAQAAAIGPARPLPAYSAGSMLIRREAFARVGLFDAGLRVGEFIDWYARAEDAGLRHRLLDDVVLLRRVHAASMTARAHAARADYARVVRTIAARRARVRGAGA